MPDVSGSYSGTIEDNLNGPGTFTADIVQNGSALTGSWNSTFAGPETIKGKVRPNNKVHMRLKVTGGRKCGANVNGTFQNGNEIAGVYHTTGCPKPDHGTFDIFD